MWSDFYYPYPAPLWANVLPFLPVTITSATTSASGSPARIQLVVFASKLLRPLRIFSLIVPGSLPSALAWSAGTSFPSSLMTGRWNDWLPSSPTLPSLQQWTIPTVCPLKSSKIGLMSTRSRPTPTQLCLLPQPEEYDMQEYIVPVRPPLLNMLQYAMYLYISNPMS